MKREKTRASRFTSRVFSLRSPLSRTLGTGYYLSTTQFYELLSLIITHLYYWLERGTVRLRESVLNCPRIVLHVPVCKPPISRRGPNGVGIP